MMKKLFLAAVVLSVLCAFVSCGGAGMKEEYSSAGYGSARQVVYDQELAVSADMGFNAVMPEAAKAYAVPEMPAPSDPLNVPVSSGRKLIMTTHLSIRVDDLSLAAETIAAMIKNYGAYSSSTSIEENRQSYNIRVPIASYDAMVNQANGLGKVDSRSDFAEDVTLNYYDIEGRLNMRRELLNTYQEYLGRAANIEEIMSVEKKIAELQNEIDMYGSQFTRLNDQIDYATINLTVYSTTSGYTYEAPSVGDRIKDMFGGYGDFLSSALVAIVKIIVYGIPILAAAALAFWILFGKIGLLRKLWTLIARKK
jgi:hypothetical protein